jgi:uncharacterized protein YcbX
MLRPHPAPRVTGIFVYPIKSTRGRAIEHATVEPWGLGGDRRWALIDHQGRSLTAREHPRLLHVAAVPDSDGGLEVSYPQRTPLRIRPPTGGDRVAVGFSRLDMALAAGPAADAWLSAVVGEPVRLVWLDDPRRRPVDSAHGGRPGDPLSLADAGPLLLTSTASLRQLDRWVAMTADQRGEPRPPPLAMTRFRPNLVVDAAVPFAEDTWKRLRVGEVTFRQTEPCDRCVLTTIDPDTLDRSHEPIRTLARHRRQHRKVWFGVRLAPEGTGTIRLGDRLEVLSPPAALSGEPP